MPEHASWILFSTKTILCVKQIVFLLEMLEYATLAENAHPHLRSAHGSQGQQFIPPSVIDPSSLLKMTASADRVSLFCGKFLPIPLPTLLYHQLLQKSVTTADSVGEKKLLKVLLRALFALRHHLSSQQIQV